MARYFTVDRKKSLKIGQTINLVKYNDVEPHELQMHVDSLFPNGVTSHGEQYILQGNTPAQGFNGNIELLFEYVRRSHFSSRPSRFQSVFACETIDKALVFRRDYGIPDSWIWEVNADNAFKADMKLLTLQDSLLVLSYRAHRYWNGLPNDENPAWEYLLIPPVSVVQKISV